MMVVGEGANAL